MNIHVVPCREQSVLPLETQTAELRLQKW